MTAFELWILGWIDLAVGIVVILTGGAYNPSWELQYCFWTVERSGEKPVVQYDYEARKIRFWRVVAVGVFVFSFWLAM